MIRISYFFPKAQSKIGFWQCDSYNSLREKFRPKIALPKCQKIDFFDKNDYKTKSEWKLQLTLGLYISPTTDFDNMIHITAFLKPGQNRTIILNHYWLCNHICQKQHFFESLGGWFWVSPKAYKFHECGKMNNVVKIHCWAEISSQNIPKFSIIIGYVMILCQKHFLAI